MLVEELLQTAREVGRHRDEPAFTLHRLEHGAGDGGGVDVTLEEMLQAGDRVVLADPAEGIRRRRPVHLGGERAEARLVGDDLRGHGHREERAAVERVVEDDHRRTAGRHARDLDGVLDRLGARVEQHRLLVGPAAGRELGEPPAHLHVRLVHPDHEALVHVLVDLGVHRIDDRGQVVAEVGTAEPAGEVDVLAPVGVPDPRALGPFDHQARSRDAAGDVALAAFLDALGCASLLQRHGNRDCIGVIQSAKARRRRGEWPGRAARYHSRPWRLGRVVRQRPAKPFTAVRIC